jgi:hypothetical protein
VVADVAGTVALLRPEAALAPLSPVRNLVQVGLGLLLGLGTT